MSNTTKWVLAVIIVVIIIIIGFTGDKTPTSAEPIKIGFTGALTGNGASYGEEDKNAATLAVEEINSNGGINGRQLELIYEDSRCNGTDGVNAVKKLIEIDNVKIILGDTCSGVMLAAAPIVEAAEVLLFSSFATSPDITNAGDFIFRNSPSDLDSGKATANLAIRNGAEKVSVVTESTDFATGFAEVFSSTIKESGGAIVSSENFAPETTDFRSFVTKAISENPDAILVSPQSEAGGLFVKQLREQGYKGPIYSNLGINGTASFRSSEGATLGVYYSDTAGLSKDNKTASDFLLKYKSRFGKNPDFASYAGAKYDAVNLVAQAISKVGEDTSAIRDYLYNLDGYEGTLGTISFDQNGDVEGVSFADYQIGENGLGIEI